MPPKPYTVHFVHVSADVASTGRSKHKRSSELPIHSLGAGVYVKKLVHTEEQRAKINKMYAAHINDVPFTHVFDGESAEAQLAAAAVIASHSLNIEVLESAHNKLIQLGM